MHPTTVSKIEAAERSVRITEAVGFAELFGVSLDNLLGRPDDSTVTFALSTLCSYAGDVQRQIKRAQEVAADIGDQLESVEESFDLDGLDDLRHVANKMGESLQISQSNATRLVALVSGGLWKLRTDEAQAQGRGRGSVDAVSPSCRRHHPDRSNRQGGPWNALACPLCRCRGR